MSEPVTADTPQAGSMMAGKVVVVTGAGGGIGREIAIMMASEGARVIINDIGASLTGEGSSDTPAQQTKQIIEQRGGQAEINTDSVASWQGGRRIIQSALDHFGRIDAVVNNAGILRDVIFHKMSHSDWSDVIAVHLNGSFNMSRAVAGLFREQGAGSYVHMTSTSGLIGNFGQANYMAAKLGIMGLSRGIALDMARFNVRSNCIAPFAFTRMIESIPTQSEQDKKRIEAFQRMTPEKIAPLAVYLGSDAAADITGQIFSVRNNEIYLFNQPRPIKTIHRAEGWTPEQLATELKPALAASFTALERSEDVFNWDPV